MNTATVLITLGALLLAGLAVESLGRRTALPRVTLLLLFGILIGPEGMGLLPGAVADQWFEPITTLALVMVGFLVGERFSVNRLREHGRVVVTTSVIEALGTAAVTALGLLALGAPAPLALLLGGVACATAPASTYDVVSEEAASGPFTDTLLGVIAIDDAWGLLIFSLAAAGAAAMIGDAAGPGFLLHALREIGGAVLIGAVLGVAAGLLTQRVQAGEPTVLEAAGIVLLTAGVATQLEVSFILAAMVLGAVMTNVARHHERAFHEIEHLEWPFVVLFFVLAGASLQLAALAEVGLVGAGYVVLRVVGKLAGAALGGRIAGAEDSVQRWMGLALMPQAGVALGMALIVEQRFPVMGGTLLPIVVGATVVFELLGPMCVRLALRRSGEVGNLQPPNRS